MKYVITCLSCQASIELEPDEPFASFGVADVLQRAGHHPDCLLRSVQGRVSDVSQADEPGARRYIIEEVR